MYWHCSTHEAAITAFSHGYALLIGVGAHTNPAHALPTTVHDARALAVLLSDPLRCAYPPDQIRLLHDESATRQGILDGLVWLKTCAEQDPAATIVVYYSGHGYASPSNDAYWLISYDAIDTASALTAADFTAALRAVPAERLLVLLDCCRAEGMATSKHPSAQQRPFTFTPTQPDAAAMLSILIQGKGRAVFTSSRGTQFSYIRAEQDLSIFTYHLLEALKGAANQAGQTVVKLSHLMQYLGDMVPQSARAMGCDQTPFFDFTAEDFAIAAIAGGTALAEDGWYQQLDAMPLDTIPAVAMLPPLSRMPYLPNPHFVGRDEVLVDLAKALKGGGRVALGPRAAATGLGGIGKTSVAAEFVHRYGQYFAGGIFWLSFAEPSAIPGEVAHCGGPGLLNLHPTFEYLTLDEQVRLVRQAWQREVPRLLIFDNCEDPTLVQDWVPVTGGCRVLITSRRQRWPTSLQVHAQELAVLPREHSIALLQHLAPRLTNDEADAIAQELGDLPLALELAGSYLAQFARTRVATYLAELTSTIIITHPSLEGWHDADVSLTKHDRHVGRTFLVSYQHLNPENTTDALALRLLARAACLAPGEPIPLDLLWATADVDSESVSRQMALQRLVNMALVTAEAEERVLLHRLVHAFVQAVMQDTTALPVVEDVLGARAFAINMSGYPTAMQPFVSHLWWLTRQAATREDSEMAVLCVNVGYHLRATGNYGGARPLFERALAIMEQALGPEHPDTATSLNNLAALLQDTGDYAGARPLYPTITGR